MLTLIGDLVSINYEFPYGHHTKIKWPIGKCIVIKCLSIYLMPEMLRVRAPYVYNPNLVLGGLNVLCVYEIVVVHVY